MFSLLFSIFFSFCAIIFYGIELTQKFLSNRFRLLVNYFENILPPFQEDPKFLRYSTMTFNFPQMIILKKLFVHRARICRCLNCNNCGIKSQIMFWAYSSITKPTLPMPASY